MNKIHLTLVEISSPNLHLKWLLFASFKSSNEELSCFSQLLCKSSFCLWSRGESWCSSENEKELDNKQTKKPKCVKSTKSQKWKDGHFCPLNTGTYECREMSSFKQRKVINTSKEIKPILGENGVEWRGIWRCPYLILSIIHSWGFENK